MKSDAVAEVISLGPGKLMVRPKPGKKFEAGTFAEFQRNFDGSVLVTFLSQWISVQKASEILDIDYSTLIRRAEDTLIDEKPALTIARPTKGRVLVSLQSVLDYKKKCESDPEFWKNDKGLERLQREKR